MWLLSIFMRRIVRDGHLAVIDAQGVTHHFGEIARPPVTIALHDSRVATELALHPQWTFGEAYMDERLTVEGNATIADLLDLLQRNVGLGFGGGYLDWFAKTHGAMRRVFDMP